MTSSEFVHLHVHSEYSLLDGANRIQGLVDSCVKDGQNALALTDHGNMFGGIELYEKCTKAGIKPIMGCEVYIAQESRLLPHSRRDNPYTHLTLLARTQEGFQNLMKMSSISYVDGYHVRPRIDRSVLEEYGKGITCLSGCLSGEINRLFLRDKEAEAERTAMELRDIFGPEHFWLELQRNGIQIQNTCNEALVRMNQRTGIPLVATNDIHYSRHEDCAVQDVLLCINTGAKRDDEKRFRMDTDTLFFRTAAEMKHEFRDLPHTVPATLDVAEQVNVKIEFGEYHLPIFVSDTGESQDVLFDRLCKEGIHRLYPTEMHAKAFERLEYEVGIIREMGFLSYFLIVWDLIKWARDHDIPVGPGRGSAAGAIVAYCLDITRVCPLKYDLLFERFLNSARVSMPDIDIDFCKEGRERVLTYTRERYGAENVAQIVTFGTMASRTVVRDVGRVLDIPLRDVDRIAKAIPSGPGSPPLAVAVEQDKDLKALKDDNPELAELFNFSIKLEGMARHISTHAAGVVITDKPVDTYVPLCTNDGDVVTQWPAPQLEAMGLLKMDYLGLRTLTIIGRALANIEKAGGTPPDIDNLPEGDPKTYAMLMAGDTQGVFQLESEGMRKLLARLKPDVFEDLIAVLALYRPGPLESGMDEMFIRRKHGQEKIDYPHEILEPLLNDTYGCIVYQEQVMLIASNLGGFALNDADNLRKAMGKKKPEIMQKFSAQFLEGAVANGCKEAAAQEIWDNIVKFGGYGFNKSHSTAYALITYQTAYLKANHRLEFLAANMSCEMQDSSKIKALLDDARRSEIEVLPPDIVKSAWEFEPEGTNIRFGIGAVKGTGEKAISSLIEGRAKMKSAPTLYNMCQEIDSTDVTKLTWEALVKSGAFDFTGHNRGALLASLELAMAEGTQAAKNRKSGQTSLFGGSAEEEEETDSSECIDSSKAYDKQATLLAEYEVLGFYLSGHPLEERAGLFRMLSNTTSSEMTERAPGTQVMMAGLILNKAELVVKKGRSAGKKMARFQLEDLEGGVNVTVFPRTYEELREKVEDGQIVVCVGKTDESEEPAMLLDEILEVEEAIARFEGGLVIQIEREDRGQLAQLKEVLSRHKGSRTLFFDVNGSDNSVRRVRANSESNVAITAELAREVDELLGISRVGLAKY
ncbi:MAG: DNA polymerase-3 subunit alpha [Planctomycetota bacterium]|jgi:DNA polymerase-3 subunit alpha